MNGALSEPNIGNITMKKVAWRLVPFLGLLYIVNYLDRVNIGFAGPNGMNDALSMNASEFGLAAGIFFIGYLLLEVPSNIALHRFGGRRWLARIMITWGILATATAFTPNYGTLVVLRFLLGIAEAGFFPGIILYLTLWFPIRYRVRATAMFMVAVPVSSAIGATLSALLIEWGHGLWGLDGWRVMFLIEGIPAVILAVATWFYLTDRPSQAKWLTAEEKQWLEATLAREREAAATSGQHWPLKKAIMHPRIIALAFVYFGITYGLYAVNFFLPTIVAGFEQIYQVELSTVQQGLITSVPFAIAAIIMVPWGRHSDRTGERVWHVAIPALIGGIAIPIALYMTNPYLAMLAITLCTVSVMCAMPVFWSLPPAFLTGVAAAAGIALINSLGNLSGFGAPYVTGLLIDITGSEKIGLWIVGILSVAAAVTVLVLGAKPQPSGNTLDSEQDDNKASTI